MLHLINFKANRGYAIKFVELLPPDIPSPKIRMGMDDTTKLHWLFWVGEHKKYDMELIFTNDQKIDCILNSPYKIREMTLGFDLEYIPTEIICMLSEMSLELNANLR